MRASCPLWDVTASGRGRVPLVPFGVRAPGQPQAMQRVPICRSATVDDTVWVAQIARSSHPHRKGGPRLRRSTFWPVTSAIRSKSLSRWSTVSFRELSGRGDQQVRNGWRPVLTALGEHRLEFDRPVFDLRREVSPRRPQSLPGGKKPAVAGSVGSRPGSDLPIGLTGMPGREFEPCGASGGLGPVRQLCRLAPDHEPWCHRPAGHTAGLVGTKMPDWGCVRTYVRVG